MKDKKQSISMTGDQKKIFEEEAKQRGISLSQFALESMLKQSGEQVDESLSYEQEVKLLKIGILRAQKDKIEAEATIKQHHVSKLFNLPTPPKQQPTTILNQDGTLRCITCGHRIPLAAYPFMQADSYRKHVKDNHRRDLYPLENETCLKIVEGTIQK